MTPEHIPRGPRTALGEMLSVGVLSQEMEGKCISCGASYNLRNLRPDSGFCPNCTPPFLSPPLWLRRSPAGTRSAWQFLITIHIVYLIVFSMLLDGGVLSVPMGIYSLSVVLYFVSRLLVANRKGFPILSRPQAVGLLLLPLYGPTIFVFIFHVGQRLRYGYWNI